MINTFLIYGFYTVTNQHKLLFDADMVVDISRIPTLFISY